MIDHHNTPPGTTDRLPDQAELYQALETRFLGLWRTAGYRMVQVPTYETYALYQTLYGQEVRQRLATFNTDQEYALRPDLTAGILRMASERLGKEPPVTPLRLAASGLAFRHERIRPLRQRQFHQVGVERIGDAPGDTAGADVEILSLARLALVDAGLTGGLLRVGHAGVRGELLEGLIPDAQARTRIGALLDITTRLRDRLEPPRTGADLEFESATSQHRRTSPLEHPDAGALLAELRLMLRAGAPDVTLESLETAQETLEGVLEASAIDAGLKADAVEGLLRLTWPTASLEELADVVSGLLPGGHERLNEALGHVEACQAELEPLVLRFSLGATRWSGFYTGFLFEVEAPVLGPDVSQILGGGRYDAAMGRLGGPEVAACGFALGMERCVEAAQRLHGAATLRRRLVQREPLLIAYTDTPRDTTAAMAAAENLGRRGAHIAYHPHPIDAFDPYDPQGKPPEAFAAGLRALPGMPYRHALLVCGELFLLDVASDTMMPIDQNELFLMFGNKGR